MPVDKPFKCNSIMGQVVGGPWRTGTADPCPPVDFPPIRRRLACSCSLRVVCKWNAPGDFGEYLHHEMAVPVTNLGQGSVVQHPGVQIGYLGSPRGRDGARWSDICFS